MTKKAFITSITGQDGSYLAELLLNKGYSVERFTENLGNKRLISTIDLNNLLMVETDDAILIAKRGETQKVKIIVDKLNKLNRKEAMEHLTTYRPWGSYTVLEEGPRYKIKRTVEWMKWYYRLDKI